MTHGKKYIYYIGEGAKDEDIKASLKNEILKLSFPKEQEKQVEERKYIKTLSCND